MRFSRWLVGLLGLAFWVLPLGAGAQEASLELGPLTFGESGKQGLANFLGERVKCVDTSYKYEGQAILACAPSDHETTETFAQSFLVEGKVRMLRYLLKPAAELPQIQDQLEDMYGEVVYSGQGKREDVQGLRFWEYDPGVGCVVLSEVRPADPQASSPDQAPTRLRISVLDPTGGWVEALPGSFRGCEHLQR